MISRDYGWYGADGGGGSYYYPTDPTISDSSRGLVYDYGSPVPPEDPVFLRETTRERFALPNFGDWDQLHLINPWLYNPGIYDFTYDYGIPPAPPAARTTKPVTKPKPTTPSRWPSLPGSSGTTRPTPKNQQCAKPFIYDAKTKKCVLPPCPPGQAFSITQNKCVPVEQLTPEDEVNEPFPWWLVVLIGTGLVILTSRPKK